MAEAVAKESIFPSQIGGSVSGSKPKESVMYKHPMVSWLGGGNAEYIQEQTRWRQLHSGQCLFPLFLFGIWLYIYRNWCGILMLPVFLVQSAPGKVKCEHATSFLPREVKLCHAIFQNGPEKCFFPIKSSPPPFVVASIWVGVLSYWAAQIVTQMVLGKKYCAQKWLSPNLTQYESELLMNIHMTCTYFQLKTITKNTIS